MPLIKYVSRRFSPGSLELIEHANVIIAEYENQGFVLTLRQLYYQFVSRDLIRNTVREYKRLGSVINDARQSGMIDWSAIEDRTRNLAAFSHWDTPGEIIQSAAASYRNDKWADQPYRIEVWIEKEALAGVFEGICHELVVPFLSCRGYTSQSEMWSAAMRLKRYERDGQQPIILHFGDHDPSGIDMSRDIADRLEMFGARVSFERVALNMDQVNEHQPPPNPAKSTDSRFRSYVREFGDESWELDALEPRLLAELVRQEVYSYRDAQKWAKAVRREDKDRKLLNKMAGRWDEVVAALR